MPKPTVTSFQGTLERLMSKVVPVGDCWQWTAAQNGTGYGYFKMSGSMTLAHRASWLLFRGEIPGALVIDHLCRNRLCINPEHLEPVSDAVNQERRGLQELTHCTNGHEYAPSTTSTYRGRRVCLICKRARSQRYESSKSS